MEVHHHPDLHHKKKNFKEYFLEFLMIFLAVTLGFFAESYREHISERAKEKEYMHSLLTDLKSDTALISETVNYNKSKYQMDSMLLRLLQLPKKDSQTLHKIYELYPETQNFDFQINDSKTIDQLKSTGDYRLIKNKSVLDSMAKYYQHIAIVTFFRDEIQSQLQLTYNFSFKIIDLYSFNNNANLPVPLITNDVALLKEYSNKLYSLVLAFKGFNGFLTTIKYQAVNLILLINKEYHFDNE